MSRSPDVKRQADEEVLPALTGTWRISKRRSATTASSLAEKVKGVASLDVLIASPYRGTVIEFFDRPLA